MHVTEPILATRNAIRRRRDRSASCCEQDPITTKMATSTVVTDNRARTYLANERTFLAWLRSGMTMIALGIAALELLSRSTSRLASLHEVIGLSLVCGGILLIVMEWLRYRRRSCEIEMGRVHASHIAVTVAALTVGAIGVLAALFIVMM